MPTENLLDDLLEHHELISPRTGAYLKPRRRAKRNAQRAVTKTWNHRSWPWRVERGQTVTATPGDPHPLLPANFGRFDRGGGVFPVAGSPPIGWVPPGEMTRLLMGLNRTGVPRNWTVGDQDSSGRKRLLLEPVVTTATVIRLVYTKRSPRLFDAFDVDDAAFAGPDDDLDQIPEQWVESVIYEWTVYYQMKDKANIQSVNEQKTLAKEALATMVTEEMTGAHSPNRLPFYGRR